MPMNPATKARIIARFEDIATVMRSRMGREGSKLAVLSKRVSAAFPSDKVFHMLDVVGEHLGKESDRLVLTVGTHAQVQDSVRDLNRAAVAWLTTFFGPAQGHRIGRNVAVEIEQQAAGFLLESHHVVEVRMVNRYAADLAAYAPSPGGPPDPDLMVTIAIPASLHRGARYTPLDGKSARLVQLRDSLPDQDYNLTKRLQDRFDSAYLADPANTFSQYLSDLSNFYKSELPELYKETLLPDGRIGGIRAALLQIAKDTGQPLSLIAL